MRILRHRLDIATRADTPNTGGELAPRYIVIHYTATPTAESAVNWLNDRRARASTHLVIGSDGQIWQLAPFNRVTWHAGRSSWDGLVGMNQHSIGIELDNPGRLEAAGDGTWRAWFGAIYAGDKLMIAAHKHRPAETFGWPVYPWAQIQAAAEAAMVIANAYPIVDVLGHDDISPGRKVDPGPSFPMESFRSRVLGRHRDEEPQHQVRVSSLNIRKGPGIAWETVAPSLARLTLVVILEVSGSWRRVRVVGSDVEGWVHGGYLSPVS